MGTGKTLVVVESPAKAKTIKKYLGSGYEVLASKGHVKDLPKRMGIDIKNGFQETYEVIEGKEKTLSELKEAARSADRLLLAPDPDREGEAIAWHLSEELHPKGETQRVEFHEITKTGVQKGIDNPRPLNKHLYDAQRCRRVLDRIVGYDVSALVWSKLAFGLSAGRVQSVALRLIVDREIEIEKFVPDEYWNIGAMMAPTRDKAATFPSRLSTKNGKKLEVTDGTTAKGVREDLQGASYRISKLTTSERKRKAPAPYSTSKLQQDAVNRLGFGAKRTMQIAQGLYEGIDLGKEYGGQVGLITYMRTDSTRISPDFQKSALEYIEQTYGKEYTPKVANTFKARKGAQEAHEAVRPTTLELPPDLVRKHLKEEQYKLYKLIWERFLASQMKEAVYDQTSVEIEATAKSGDKYGLRASGRVLKFSGWLEAYGKATGEGGFAGEGEGESEGEGAASEAKPKFAATEGNDDVSLPKLVDGEALALVTPPGVNADQKFTQPPPRYSEGTLVKELEERGIGRPSTYAEIISKVQARDYVEKLDGGRFKPTDLGRKVVSGLIGAELDFMDPTFTSAMEGELDAVEAGKDDRVQLLERFYKRFTEQLAKSKKGQRWAPDPEPTGVKCDLCADGEMMKRWSKNGWFLSCSNYSKKPKCENKSNLAADGSIEVPQETGILCDQCGKPMVIRTGRFGQFLSCTGYPACKNAKPVPLGIKCPKCIEGDLIEVRARKKGGRTFYGCSRWNEEGLKCDFKLWNMPVDEQCPDCKKPYMVKGGGKQKPVIMCADKACGYKRAVVEEDETAVPEAKSA
ncbi:MAG: type I DNA topoisomerase [Polyangiaceae bacterium]